MTIDDDLIIRYKKAYRAANGNACPYHFTYSHGWYQMRFPHNRVLKRCRRAALLEWTERLEQRARGVEVGE